MRTSGAEDPIQASAGAERPRISDVLGRYYKLTKPKVVGLIMFTAIVGMFLSVPGMVDPATLLLASLGIGMAAASGAAVNHLLDVDADRLMARTRRRPLATGEADPRKAFVLAMALAAGPMLVLTIWVNTLTAVLTFLSLIGYAVVYTVYLKHATPQNIVIGGAAGAAPPVLGWTAVTGELSGYALLLFLIVFVWTPPHFWALALYRAQDYARAGIPMLPVTHGEQYTRLQIVLYTLLLAAVSLLPFVTGMSGLIYLVGAVVLNGLFLHYAVRLYRRYSDVLARRTFVYSIQYLAMLFALMLLDHYRRPLAALLGIGGA